MASTRKQARLRLKTLFGAAGTFNVVHAYAPVSLQGYDKALCIYTANSSHEQMSKDMEHSFYVVYLDVFVRRDGGQDAEDTLDDLHETVRSVIRANQGDSAWDYLELQPSNAFFAEQEGVPYRIERHPLRIKITQ